jgi:RNA polymerase sigma factor (sigma-70 family)
MGNCNRKSLSAQAVEEAMDQHDGLVHAFIRRQGGGAISYEEALQAGRIGLWRAIERYDPARGTTFSTYAWVAICNQIRQRAIALKRERGKPWGEIPASWHAPDPETWVEREFIEKVLLDMVSQLPKRLQQVIIGRYGLGENLPCTLKQIGEELGVCKERVRQLQQEALAWLRHPAHSWRLRQLADKNTADEYRQVLAQNAALRCSRRRGK